MADAPGLAQRVLMLQAAISYQMDDLLDTKALIDQCAPDESDTLINQAPRPSAPPPRHPVTRSRPFGMERVQTFAQS